MSFLIEKKVVWAKLEIYQKELPIDFYRKGKARFQTVMVAFEALSLKLPGGDKLSQEITGY